MKQRTKGCLRQIVLWYLGIGVVCLILQKTVIPYLPHQPEPKPVATDPEPPPEPKRDRVFDVGFTGTVFAVQSRAAEPMKDVTLTLSSGGFFRSGNKYTAFVPVIKAKGTVAIPAMRFQTSSGKVYNPFGDEEFRYMMVDATDTKGSFWESARILSIQ